MISTGVDVSLTNDQGWNALHFAAYHNRRSVAILNLLIQHKTCTLETINQMTHQGYTVLDSAHGSFVNGEIKEAAVALLRSKGATANRHDWLGYPL